MNGDIYYHSRRSGLLIGIHKDKTLHIFKPVSFYPKFVTNPETYNMYGYIDSFMYN